MERLRGSKRDGSQKDTYTQINGVDYNETYAPVSQLNTFRIFLTIAAREDLELRQGDFKTAFLTVNLVETVSVHGASEGVRVEGRGRKDACCSPPQSPLWT